MPRPVPRDEVRAEAVLQMLRIVEVVINIDAVQRTRPPDFSAVISLLIGSKRQGFVSGMKIHAVGTVVDDAVLFADPARLAYRIDALTDHQLLHDLRHIVRQSLHAFPHLRDAAEINTHGRSRPFRKIS